MSDLLLVMHPRKIEECVQSIAALEIDKAWLTGYTETQLETIIPQVIADTCYDRYIIVSDDVVVTPQALHALRHVRQYHPVDHVLTGWTNLDMTDAGARMSSVTRRSFTEHRTVDGQYEWIPIREILEGPHALRRTWFAGMCLTSMTREQWHRFPFHTYSGHGYSSDFELSWRLQEAHVPVYAVREAGVFHVKQVTNYLDKDPRKALHLLGADAYVRFEAAGSVREYAKTDMPVSSTPAGS